MGLISFSLGVNWIPQLYKKLQRIQEKRGKELNKINDILSGDPLELAQYYVEPNCQEINPADRYEEDHLVSCEPVYKKINEFLKAKYLDQPGNKQMFILSDTGMGKTSLLVMLKLLHLTSFWPKNTDCVLKILGKEALVEIQLIENKRNTILLLDALDEDPDAYGRLKDRLLDVLKATKTFYRVIITCRTQFFPDVDKGPFQRPGLISVGGYVCPVKYLSLFNEEKVELYLNKRFPGKDLYSEHRIKIEKAKKLVEQMGSLRCRPMLLSYIDKLMDSPIIHVEHSEYNIYNAMVDSWLTREESKKGIPKKELLNACKILAAKISVLGAREISETDLDSLIADISGLKNVKTIDIKGHSLLNRNSSGDYRFSHHSIQEFLVVKYFIENSGLKVEKKLPMTILIAQMLLTKSKFKICQKFFYFDNSIFRNLSIQGLDIKEEDLKEVILKGSNFKGVDFRGFNLSEANLKGADLQVANLQGINLKNANLDEVNLLGANLQGANLQGASFKMADLSWTDLKSANLRGASLRGADLQGAILRGANLLDTDIKDTVLNGADLQGTKINVTRLMEAKLYSAILQGLNFRGADLKEAVLNGTDLQGADLRDAEFQGARFEGADLSWADLQRADFRGAKFQGARFEGADLSWADFQDADLRSSNFKGANIHRTRLDNANLQDVDFSGVENITSEMLLRAGSLYQVKGLDSKIEVELKRKNPILFDGKAQHPTPEV